MHEYKRRAEQDIERIRAALNADQRSAYEISSMTGINASAIHRLKREPSVGASYAVLKELARVLGLTIEVKEQAR